MNGIIKRYLPYAIIIFAVFLLVPLLFLPGTPLAKYSPVAFYFILLTTAVVTSAAYCAKHGIDFLFTLMAPIAFLFTMIYSGGFRATNLILLFVYLVAGIFGQFLGDLAFGDDRRKKEKQDQAEQEKLMLRAKRRDERERKRMESEALSFLKEYIEEHREPEPELPATLCPEAQNVGEKLLRGLRKKAAHSRLHVGSIPFIACSADHPETISGIADLTVIMAEQRKSSSCAPKWVISSEAGQELRVCIDFPVAKAYLCLHIDNVTEHCRKAENTKDAPDLSEWLWFLASDLWLDKEETGYDTLEKLHMQRRFVRDICNAVLDRQGG